MEIITLKKYNEIVNEYLFFEVNNFIKEEDANYQSPSFGEIWICLMPIIVFDGANILFKTLKRPVLVIDDTKGHFIKNDQKNYYVLKITSQPDSYQRIKIKNLESTGLLKESFIRLEIPLKVEKNQFLYQIGYYKKEFVIKILEKIVKNIQKKLE